MFNQILHCNIFGKLRIPRNLFPSVTQIILNDDQKLKQIYKNEYFSIKNKYL